LTNTIHGFDFKNAGRRVELVSLYGGDKYTQLKPSDKGTYEFYNLYGKQHNIKWDDGSTLMLIEGKDVFKFIS
jgi:hypothetical protein